MCVTYACTMHSSKWHTHPPQSWCQTKQNKKRENGSHTAALPTYKYARTEKGSAANTVRLSLTFSDNKPEQPTPAAVHEQAGIIRAIHHCVHAGTDMHRQYAVSNAGTRPPKCISRRRTPCRGSPCHCLGGLFAGDLTPMPPQVGQATVPYP